MVCLCMFRPMRFYIGCLKNDLAQRSEDLEIEPGYIFRWKTEDPELVVNPVAVGGEGIGINR